MRRWSRILPLLATALVLHGGAALADADADARKAREHEMLRRAQEELQKSQEDNAQLAADKSQLESQLKAAQASLSSEQAASKASRARSARAESDLKQARTADAEHAAKLQDALQQLDAANRKQAETAAKVAEQEKTIAQVQGELAKSNDQIAACEAKNDKLFEYGEILLQKYRDKGVWDSLAQKDPVLGLKRVDIENVLEEYRSKLARQKIQQH